MANDDDTVSREREAKARKASDRAADGVKAMAEYEADRVAVEANTLRLRALRQEKESAERQAAEAAEAAKAPARPKARSRASRASAPA